MIAQLSSLSASADPTPFHNILRALDDKGRLLRVYTQNIDAIEEKCGLSFGVPEWDWRGKGTQRAGKGTGKEKERAVDVVEMDTLTGFMQEQEQLPATSASTPSSSRLPTPPPTTPRCIPLHGTLQYLHCPLCTHTFPLTSYLPALISGSAPHCPECVALEQARAVVGKRRRGVGRLRPSVVLYGEEHRDGEGVGEVVRRDLMGFKRKWKTKKDKDIGDGVEGEVKDGTAEAVGKGKEADNAKVKTKAKAKVDSAGGYAGADLVLVVGTSLKVPGTKRMVREFAKAVRCRGGGVKEKEKENGKEREDSGAGLNSTPAGSNSASSSRSGLATPTPSPRRSPTVDGSNSSSPPDPLPLPKAIYLNLDFPVPTREWEGVFDVWVQGDAQTFASMLEESLRGGDIGRDGKKRKSAEQIPSSDSPTKAGAIPVPSASTPKKRKANMALEPPTPPYTPPSTLARAVGGSPEPMHTDEDRGLGSKFYVRIPAQNQQQRHGRNASHLVPEVYITSLPGQSGSGGISKPQSPSSMAATTGTNTPVVFNKRTKAGRRAAREARDKKRAERLAGGAASTPQSSSSAIAPTAVTPLTPELTPAHRKAHNYTTTTGGLGMGRRMSMSSAAPHTYRRVHGHVDNYSRGRDLGHHYRDQDEDMVVDVDTLVLGAGPGMGMDHDLDIGMDLDAEDRMYMRKLGMNVFRGVEALRA